MESTLPSFLPKNDALDSKETGKKRRKRVVSRCPHTDKKYYAKNMCFNCYHRQGRTKMASKCEHHTDLHYSKGLCKNCYLSEYHRDKKEGKTVGKRPKMEKCDMDEDSSASNGSSDKRQKVGDALAASD